MIINLSIDLSLIEKSKIKEIPKKDGTKGKFYDIVVFTRDEPDNYGNTASVISQQSKDDRDNKVKPTYIGNGKIAGMQNATTKPTKEEDDLPF